MAILFVSSPAWYLILLYVLVRGHLTTMAVTLYLHRSVTHQTVYFDPILDQIFRFVLWFWTSIVTKTWVAIHRKHHSTVDGDDDPHSPRRFGITKVFFLGWWLYKVEAKNKETIRCYGYCGRGEMRNDF